MTEEREYTWDEEIPAEDENEIVLLPEGEYDFEVVKFERKRFAGSAKLPPCNQAAVMVRLLGGDRGTGLVTHNLFLHSKTKGLLCQFFRAIGTRKHGDTIRMDWNAVPGARGRCKVGVRKYEGNDYNEIKRFLDPEPQQPQPQPQPEAPAQPAGAAYVPGKF